jgi:hypothetical protein
VKAGAAPSAVKLTRSDWALAIAGFLVLLSASEWFLRSDRLWRLPLSYSLAHQNDRHALVSWEVHQTPPPRSIDVASFGSSIAAAVTELPGDEAGKMLREASGRAEVRHLVMAVPAGCFDEASVILENLIAQHRPPRVALIFTAPACFVREDAEASRARDVLLARLMPLQTSWHEPSTRMDSLAHWLVRNVAVVRYRYFINTWMRRRLDEGLSRGDWRVSVPYRPYQLARPARVPLEQLRGMNRYDPADIDAEGPVGDVAARLLARARAAGIVPILVENPMSYAVRDRLAPVLPAYKKRIEAVAARTGVLYLDLNAEVDLRGQFADVHHPTHEGGRRYFRAIAPFVATALSAGRS